MLSSHEQGSVLQAITDCHHNLPITGWSSTDYHTIQGHVGLLNLSNVPFRCRSLCSLSLDGPCISKGYDTHHTYQLALLPISLPRWTTNHLRTLFQTMNLLTSIEGYAVVLLMPIANTLGVMRLQTQHTVNLVPYPISGSPSSPVYNMKQWPHEHIASSMKVVQLLGVTWP